jgi:hypothetical protein
MVRRRELQPGLAFERWEREGGVVYKLGAVSPCAVDVLNEKGLEQMRTLEVGTETETDGTYLRPFLVDHFLLLLGCHHIHLPARSCALALRGRISGRCRLLDQYAAKLLQEVVPTSDLALRFFALGGE